MSWCQTLMHTNNSFGIGTPQGSHNIMHCVSLHRLFTLVRALKGSKFTHAKNLQYKWGGPGHPISSDHEQTDRQKKIKIQRERERERERDRDRKTHTGKEGEQN